MVALNGIITEAGIAAALSSETRGASFQVSYFKIGAKADFAPAPTDTDVYIPVYTGHFNQLTYRVLNNAAMVFRITLGSEVGDFNIGNIGLFLNTGDLFALATFYGGNFKYKDAPPDVIGNIKTIDILIPIMDVAGAVSFIVNNNSPSGIPTVTTNAHLPPPENAEFNLYIIQANTEFNNFPTLSYTDGQVWLHSRLIDRSPALYFEQYQGGSLPRIGAYADNSVAIGTGSRVEEGSQRSIALGPCSVEGPDNLVGQVGSNFGTNRTIAKNAVVFGRSNRGGNSLDDEFNTVIGGFDNQVEEARYSAIIGGQDNEINGQHSFVGGGSQTWITTDYTRGFAAGQFQQTGDAQVFDTIIRTETTDSNIRKILIGNYQTLQLPAYSSWNFTCELSASNVGGIPLNNTSIPVTAKSWLIRGTAVKGSHDIDTILLGSVKQVIVQGPGTEGWDVILQINTQDGTLEFQASGAISTKIYWMGHLRINQLKVA